ncbi:hypothetical protein GGX14DRAFT_396985 [Mycena pura]|uniref:Uncharacterized protein n=1 Tax=Mycena pura TaxID=153505 RepID=A0AAD6VGR4_9AGAR|nr:hypothetical protein GGX14DRAFT_396985 [Mycena pura]
MDQSIARQTHSVMATQAIKHVASTPPLTSGCFYAGRANAEAGNQRKRTKARFGRGAYTIPWQRERVNLPEWLPRANSREVLLWGAQVLQSFESEETVVEEEEDDAGYGDQTNSDFLDLFNLLNKFLTTSIWVARTVAEWVVPSGAKATSDLPSISLVWRRDQTCTNGQMIGAFASTQKVTGSRPRQVYGRSTAAVGRATARSTGWSTAQSIPAFGARSIKRSIRRSHRLPSVADLPKYIWDRIRKGPTPYELNEILHKARASVSVHSRLMLKIPATFSSSSHWRSLLRNEDRSHQ